MQKDWNEGSKWLKGATEVKREESDDEYLESQAPPECPPIKVEDIPDEEFQELLDPFFADSKTYIASRPSKKRSGHSNSKPSRYSAGALQLNNEREGNSGIDRSVFGLRRTVPRRCRYSPSGK